MLPARRFSDAQSVIERGGRSEERRTLIVGKNVFRKFSAAPDETVPDRLVNADNGHVRKECRTHFLNIYNASQIAGALLRTSQMLTYRHASFYIGRDLNTEIF